MQDSETVLIVDDEVEICESLRRAIERRFPNVIVRTAGSGREALDIMARESVDLILSDHKMPGMTGVEFLARVHATSPSVRRVLVTAFGDIDLVMRAANDAHASRFINKPFRLEEALELVGTLLNERRIEIAREAAMARTLEMAERMIRK